MTEHITFPPMLFSSRISVLQFILSRIVPSVDRAHHTSPNAILIPYIALTIHTISNPAFSGQSTSHFSPMLFSSRISLLQFILSRILPSVERAHHTSPNAILIPYIALTIHTISNPAFSGQSTSHFPPMLFSSRISLLQFILSRILPSVNRAHHTFPKCYSHPVYRSYNSYYPAYRLQWTEHITLSPNAILIPYIGLTIHTIPHPAFSDRAHHTSPNAILIPYIALTIHTISNPAFSGQSTSHFSPMLFSSRISLLQFILSRIPPSVERAHHTFPQCYSHPVYHSCKSYYPASHLQWKEHITLSPNAILIPYIALTIHTIPHPVFSGQSTSHFPNAILIPYVALTIHTIPHPAFRREHIPFFAMLLSSMIT